MKINMFIPFFSCVLFPSSCISQSNDQLKELNTKLANGQTTVSQVLSDPALMSLHPVTAFRDIIKQHAKAEKITLTTSVEPGTKITVRGLINDRAGKPLPNKLVYVYQTSSTGWYSDTAPHILKNEGDRRHARLFGYFKTNAAGGFEFTTVKPSGYPGSELPAHIHIEIDLGGSDHYISELLFDDDPRLVDEIRERASRDKFYIVKNTGTATSPVFAYILSTAN